MNTWNACNIDVVFFVHFIMDFIGSFIYAAIKKLFYCID